MWSIIISQGNTNLGTKPWTNYSVIHFRPFVFRKAHTISGSAPLRKTIKKNHTAGFDTSDVALSPAPVQRCGSTEPCTEKTHPQMHGDQTTFGFLQLRPSGWLQTARFHNSLSHLNYLMYNKVWVYIKATLVKPLGFFHPAASFHGTWRNSLSSLVRLHAHINQCKQHLGYEEGTNPARALLKRQH